ncbi:MAG TPA: sialidase family protein [Thermoanaerobaculia bacterium]|jgi:hypothetical protein
MLLVSILLALTIAEVPSPAPAGAAEPHLYARDGRLIMSWLEPGVLKFATMSGGKWSEARTVVARPDLLVNWADFPSVISDSKGTLFAQWLVKDAAAPHAYDAYVASSRDGGRTWRKAKKLENATTPGERGFVSLVARSGGGVEAVWLSDGTLNAANVDAAMNLTGTTRIDTRTCECCGTGAAMTSAGAVAVYRDRSQEEVRDISVVRHVDGKWTAPAPLHADGWKIQGCPVNGPQIDASGRRVAVAWFTEKAVQVAFSTDSGATFVRPIRIDGGKATGRVDVLLVPDGALVTWIDDGNIVVRHVRPDGVMSEITRVATASAARAVGFPRAALVGDAAFIAWTEPGEGKRVRLARVGW